MRTLQPFLFLGTVLLGTDIANLVLQQMVLGTEHPGSQDYSPVAEGLVLHSASQFYESIRQAGLRMMRALGPGVVICGMKSIHFVRATDLQRFAVLEANAAPVIAFLERSRDASVVRLGARRRRTVIGHIRPGGKLFRNEMLDRGLQYLLEYY